jgi:ATP-dependent DNA helicase RecQ
VRDEILDVLGMRDPEVIVRGFDARTSASRSSATRRPTTSAARCSTASRSARPARIVYCATKKGAEEVSAELRERGVRAEHYHGGLSSKVREERQHAFMSGAGIDVMVATIAFGWGSTRPTCAGSSTTTSATRSTPTTRRSGRAGRDGEPAEAVLFYRPQDLGLRRFFASGRVRDDELHQVAQALIVPPRPVRPRELLEDLPLSDTKLATAIQHLEEAGFAEQREDGAIGVNRDQDLIEAVEQAAAAEEHRQAFDRSRVDMMRSYAETDGCRRAFVLGYFGEDYEPPCGSCDVCERRGEEVARTEDDGRFAVGDRVTHAEWGGGSVGQLEDGQVTVVFDTVGYKTLGLDIVLERGLLEAE